MPPLNFHLLSLLGSTFLVLGVASIVRKFALRNSSPEMVQQRMGSLKVWWLLAVLWSVASLTGLPGATLLLALASFLGMREFLRLVGSTPVVGRAAIAAMFLVCAIHYSLILAGRFDLAKWFLPVIGLLLLGMTRSILYDPTDYTRLTASCYWGVLLIVYGFSHALFLFEFNDVAQPLVGPAGWFLFLILLTESNDISQAIVGRKLGKTKITPRVSPNKSLEGLLGGVAVTALLAVVLAPFLTTFNDGRSTGQTVAIALVAGLLIAIAGFLGDINMSAVKRDANVKDGSNLLPGMGGVIDRIDSMTYSGPCFYYFVILVDQFTTTE